MLTILLPYHTATRKTNKWIIANKFSVEIIGLRSRSSTASTGNSGASSSSSISSSSISSKLNFEGGFFKFSSGTNSIQSLFFNAETYAEINGKIYLRFRKIIYVRFRKYYIRTYFNLLFYFKNLSDET